MPRTARVKLPFAAVLPKLGLSKDTNNITMADLSAIPNVLKKLGFPADTKIITVSTQYEGRLTLHVEHPDLIEHHGMNPPFVDPHFGDGPDDFRWNQKPPVLMGPDGTARKRELAERRRRAEGGHQPQADGPVDLASLKMPRGGSDIGSGSEQPGFKHKRRIDESGIADRDEPNLETEEFGD